MRSTPIPCTALLFGMCSYSFVFSIIYLLPLLQTFSLFSVCLYPFYCLLLIGVGKRVRTDRLFMKGCVLQCVRSLHTKLSHAGEIRQYCMTDIGIGSEVHYRWQKKQRMPVEDDLQGNPKK